MSGRAKPARPRKRPPAAQHQYVVSAYARTPGLCGRCGKPPRAPIHMRPAPAN